jgi:hypothetical protein
LREERVIPMARQKKELPLLHEKATNGSIVAPPRLPKGWDADPARKDKDAAHLKNVEEKAAPASKPIILPKLDIRTIKIGIVGDSPLIVHRWSEKAIRQMLSKQMGTATAGQEKKDPERDYRDSLYVISAAPKGKPFEEGTFGFPTIAFKCAAVEACTSLGKNVVTKVAARQAFHVVGELARIVGKPRMREDMVRVGMGTADIRYRGEFPEWRTELTIRYNARLLSDEQVMNLFNTAGFAVGIGEWRSERDGGFGLFHVV